LAPIRIRELSVKLIAMEFKTPEMAEVFDRSSDNPAVLGSVHSKSEIMQQQVMDLEMLNENVEEYLRSISITFDKRTETFLVKQENEEEPITVPKEELAVALNELNAEAFIFFQQLNFSLALCSLRKAGLFCQVNGG
jgi:hypothetical protein